MKISIPYLLMSPNLKFIASLVMKVISLIKTLSNSYYCYLVFYNIIGSSYRTLWLYFQQYSLWFLLHCWSCRDRQNELMIRFLSVITTEFCFWDLSKIKVSMILRHNLDAIFPNTSTNNHLLLYMFLYLLNSQRLL